jgi:hypothetical protein
MGCAPSTATSGPLQEMFILEHLKETKSKKKKEKKRISKILNDSVIKNEKGMGSIDRVS